MRTFSHREPSSPPVVPTITLNNGVLMPQLGIGLAKVDRKAAAQTVRAALEAGYRSIDTAKDYGNESGVGKALAESGLARDEIFVTSKVWNADHGYAATHAAFDATLERLGLDWLDLYLIHWPVPSQDRYVETWWALEEMLAARRVKAIGVSNFEPEHLRRVLTEGTVVPAVNQIELHPRLQQRELRALHEEHGIVTEAWSPLAKARTVSEPPLVRLADKRGVTTVQLILRWHLQLGNVVIPKTVSPARMRENLEAVALEPLGDAELEVFTQLDSNGRIGPDPKKFA